MRRDPILFEILDAETDARALAEGEADAEAGRVVPHEEVATWLLTWGTADERPAPDHWFKSSDATGDR